MANYGKASYWDERYTKDPEAFDWYQRYSGLKEFISQYVKKTDHILMPGCGTARLSEEMYEDGYTSIANVDISKVCIDLMVDKHRDKTGMTWQQMNCCALDFPDDTFDAVIDKSCLDSVLCGEGSTANTAKYCSEVSRVLKPQGVMFILSYGTPENRLSYLDNDEYHWKVTVHTVAKPTISATAVTDSKDASAVHYIYVCQKIDE